MRDFDAARLKAVLLAACRKAFAEIRERHKAESFYCIGLFTCGSYSYLVPTAMTEEGLDCAVCDYHAKPRYAHEPLERLRFSLRWSPCDSPLHLEGAQYFEEINTQMLDVAEALCEIDIDHGWSEFNEFVVRVRTTIVDVLSIVDREGYFGSRQQREQAFVTMLMEDQDDSILHIGRRLNPPATVARFEKEWQAWKDFWAPQET
jgi:hypothetical protein